MKQLSVVSIYVSHNSEKYIKKFSNRHRDELGEKVFIINSSSEDIDTEKFPDFEIINMGDNVGFSAANNTGIKLGAEYEPDYFLLVNPDIFLPSLWLRNMLEVIDSLSVDNIGIFTVPLLGYDFNKDAPTGLIDSLGVKHTWFGRWFDISLGDSVTALNVDLPPYEVPAACGALMLIHKGAIADLLGKDGYVFNESYFMYKEDIELSVRIRRLGKKILVVPSVPAYHCRGWDGNRKSPYWKRLLSAKNELSMHLNHCWWFVPYSSLKYIFVKFVEKKLYEK